MSNSAGFASFGSCHQAHRCCLGMCEVRVSQQGHPVFFLDSLSCIVLALMAANPSPLPGAWSLTLSLSKLRLWMRACSLFLGWEVLVSNNLCCEVSVLSFEHLMLHSLWSSEAHPWFCPWVGFWVCRNFSAFMTPSPAHRCPEILYLSFALPCSKETGLPFWSLLPVFGSCTIGVVPNAHEFLMYLWERCDLPVLFLCHPSHVFLICFCILRFWLVLLYFLVPC